MGAGTRGGAIEGLADSEATTVKGKDDKDGGSKDKDKSDAGKGGKKKK